MLNLAGSDVDFIDELKLRRWARENYVPITKRPDSWHPVVLDEMSRKDAETLERLRGRQSSMSYVPLAPGDVFYVHSGHARPKGGSSAPVNDSAFQTR